MRAIELAHSCRSAKRMALAATAAVLALAATSAGAGATDADARPRSERAERVPGSYIVLYQRSLAAPGETTERLEREQRFRTKLRYGRALKGFAAKLSARQAEQLREDPAVASVTPDRVVHALGSVPLLPGDSAPTGVRRLGAATAVTSRQASSAAVAVLDTGIDLDHPDLNAANGKNCVGAGVAEDDDGHGTHVAGTIGARNNGAGVVGVAPATKIYAVKVLDSTGSGSWSQIICGIDWAAATRTDADPANDISVANMSLGGIGDPIEPCASTSDPMHSAICNSTAAGVTYVVAAGNDGWDFDYAPSPDAPAAYPQVLTVAAASDSDGRPGGAGAPPACDPDQADDRYADFSNYAATSAGRAHTIAGPGVCIRSTWLGGGQATVSGTSMATPHLAGVVALCLGEETIPGKGGAAGPCSGLTPAEIVQKIRSDAQSYEAANRGWGFAGDPLQPVSGKYFGYLPAHVGGLATGDGGSPDPPAPAPAPAPSPQPAAASPGSGGTALREESPAGVPQADLTPPLLKLAARRRQDMDRLRIRTRMDEAGSVRISGSVKVRGRRTRFRLRTVRRTMAADRAKTFRLRMRRRSHRRVKRALRRGRRAVARVRVTATDADGNRTVRKRTIRLRP